MKTVILHAYNICLNIMPFNKPSSVIPPQPYSSGKQVCKHRAEPDDV